AASVTVMTTNAETREERTARRQSRRQEDRGKLNRYGTRRKKAREAPYATGEPRPAAPRGATAGTRGVATTDRVPSRPLRTCWRRARSRKGTARGWPETPA